jgi:hypothetical protein
MHVPCGTLLSSSGLTGVDQMKQTAKERMGEAADVLLIADRFAEILRNWLTPQEFAEMKWRNESNPAYCNHACASADYCDSNMAMQESFESVMGHLQDGDDENDCEIWNEAWELARRLHIGYQPGESEG